MAVCSYADLSVNILNEYFDKYLPQAAKLGKQLRDRGGKERLRWMTQSYVVRSLPSRAADCALPARRGPSQARPPPPPFPAADLALPRLPHGLRLALSDRG